MIDSIDKYWNETKRNLWYERDLCYCGSTQWWAIWKNTSFGECMPHSMQGNSLWTIQLHYWTNLCEWFWYWRSGGIYGGSTRLQCGQRQESRFHQAQEPWSTCLSHHFPTGMCAMQYIYSGERQNTKVYPFNDKPMICYKCQGYGHTSKRCKSNAIICRRCSAMGHYAYECKSSDFKCFLDIQCGHTI